MWDINKKQSSNGLWVDKASTKAVDMHWFDMFNEAEIVCF